MLDLLKLAQRHLEQHGMTAADAIAVLETFSKGIGRDIAWTQTATHLPRPVIDRLDRAAVGWMMAHKATEGSE